MSKSVQELFIEAENNLVLMIDALEHLRAIRNEVVAEYQGNEELKHSIDCNIKSFNIEMQILQAECILNEIFPKSLRATIKRKLTICNLGAAKVGIKQLPIEEIERECKEMVESFRDKVVECNPSGIEGTD